MSDHAAHSILTPNFPVQDDESSYKAGLLEATPAALPVALILPLRASMGCSTTNHDVTAVITVSVKAIAMFCQTVKVPMKSNVFMMGMCHIYMPYEKS